MTDQRLTTLETRQAVLDTNQAKIFLLIHKLAADIAKLKATTISSPSPHSPVSTSLHTPPLPSLSSITHPPPPPSSKTPTVSIMVDPACVPLKVEGEHSPYHGPVATVFFPTQEGTSRTTIAEGTHQKSSFAPSQPSTQLFPVLKVCKQIGKSRNRDKSWPNQRLNHPHWRKRIQKRTEKRWRRRKSGHDGKLGESTFEKAVECATDAGIVTKVEETLFEGAAKVEETLELVVEMPLTGCNPDEDSYCTVTGFICNKKKAQDGEDVQRNSIVSGRRLRRRMRNFGKVQGSTPKRTKDGEEMRTKSGEPVRFLVEVV